MHNENLKKNFDFYLKNKKDLVKDEKYYGKYIVIKDEKIIDAYKTEDEAINSMLKRGFKMGEFTVQVVRQNDGSSANFISNIYV